MKTLKTLHYKSYLACLLLFAFLLGCQLDESLPDNGEFKLKQNEGYFPLAIGNSWLYTNKLAEFNANGGLEYEDDSLRTELRVANAKRMSVNGVNQVRYEFSPISSSGIVSNLLGNYSQIYKNENGEYFKTELKEIEVTGARRNNNKLVFDLRELSFLSDDAQVGQIIDEEYKTIDFYAGAKITIDYKIVSEVTGKYNSIPIKYASTAGVDDHLNNFTDILHITDYIELVSWRVNTNTANIFIDATSTGPKDVEGGMLVETLTYQTGSICVSILGISLGGNGCAFKGIVNQDSPFNPFRPTAFSKAVQRSRSFSCPAKADILINESFDIPLTVVSNQKLLSREVFYARGVGPIKTIISTHDVLGQIKLEQENTFEVSINNEAVDPTCKFDAKPDAFDFDDLTEESALNYDKNGYGRQELLLNIDALIDNAIVDVPLSFNMHKSIVQNIRRYDIR